MMAQLMEENMCKQKKSCKRNMCLPTWGLGQDFIDIKLNTGRLAFPALPIKAKYSRDRMLYASAQEFFAAFPAW
ncbi:MAG: hypothetical protein JWM83_1362 [Candidatus Angelobacter sp.]|nr:hypothetical protein [Candidatus Angelobacter sp.]